MRTLLLPAVLLAATAFAVSHQDPLDDGPGPVQIGPGGVIVGPDGPLGLKGGLAGKDGPAGGPGESPRLAKLKQLAFDRRPSAVLKARAPQAKKDGPTPRPDPLDEEVAALQKNVTLGEWAAVKTYLASLPDEEAVAAYRQMLQSLRQTPSPLPGQLPPGTMIQPGAQQFAERNAFSVDDVLAIAAVAPKGTNEKHFAPRAAVAGIPPVVVGEPTGLTKDHLSALAGLLAEAIRGGNLPEVVVARFKAELAKGEGKAAITKRQAAKLLADAGQPGFIGDFLPTADEAQKANDLEALNLLSRHFLARQGVETETGNLEKAWAAIQAVLAVPGGDRAAQEEALVRAVELAPRLKDTLGQTWLNESFTKSPERGLQILATIGTLASQGLATRPHQTEDRLNALKLMKTAVEALLTAAPDRAKEWKPTITLLAAVWLREAEFTNQHDRSTASRLRRDRFGNMFFFDEEDPNSRMMMMQRPDMPQPIPVAELIRTAPGEGWVKAVDDPLRPRLAGTAARLYLKANDEDKAFPLIEQLAAAQPREARDLVREFVRVWTRNHDMNTARNENRYSWFFFAFETRAESIPLTRSKQERNLKELATWAARIRNLPGAADADEELLVRAFTACHSTAEVYRTEAIEAVFGPLDKVKPRTLGALTQQMRENLAGLWRDPGEQAKKKTNRKKKDIEQEVLRGYAVAQDVIADGLKKFPDHWALLSAKAGLMHDELNFRQELNRSAGFSESRTKALAVYKQAADAYGRTAPGTPEAEHTTIVYEHWFAATLGAVDLGMITEDQQPDWTQPEKIRAAIRALPGELADKHMEKFANNLFIRMSAAKPHVKFNYLKAGFQIVGDHKQAAEAKKVFDYYKDLVTEIKLDVIPDGTTTVGHGRPFGVFVNIRHTRDIERESGGFGRYLQNQNSMPYAYNYGRPTADYRDRFEASARNALKEQFEVVSVTFQDEKVNSRAEREFGWRSTPYAYILLKPRGPQVDKIPPLRLDLDFLDTSGFVVLPVESPVVPIDAKDVRGDARPVEKLSVTMTLDERQANKGVLLLEVKAVGVGLVPELDEICDIAPDGFTVEKRDDQGLAVKKFEEDADRNCVVSERTWLVTLKGRDGLVELPKTFKFPTVKVQTSEVVRQRYVDADLVAVGEEIPLEAEYGKKSSTWAWLAAAGGVFLLVTAVVIVVALRRRPKAEARTVPQSIDPFVAAALLREIRERPELTAAQRTAIDRDLDDIERHFFSADRNGSAAPDLRQMVERWTVAVPGWSRPEPAAV